MFSEIVNYVIIPTLLSASALGAYWVWRPDDSKKIISRVAWYGINMYSRAAIYFENMGPEFENIEEDMPFDEIETLSYYNAEKRMIINLGTDYKTLPDEWWKDIKINVDLLMLKKSLCDSQQYKIFNKMDDLKDSWNTLEKQFVQVELEQDNEIIDIHKHLDQFYLVGNSILSKPFLQWYVKEWYNIELSDKYSLKIFDKDVNMFSIGPESYILFGKDSYTVIDSNDYEGVDN